MNYQYARGVSHKGIFNFEHTSPILLA